MAFSLILVAVVVVVVALAFGVLLVCFMEGSEQFPSIRNSASGCIRSR